MTDGDEVEVHYVGTLESDGSKFDSSRDRSSPFKFKLGQGQVIKGWDKGVATMKLGEKSILTLRSDYAYGDAGSGAKIPGGATLKFEVELLSWSDGSWNSVYGSDSIKYKLTTEGDGYDHPAEGDDVYIKFAGTDGEGNLVHQQDDIGPVRLGTGVLPAGVEKAVTKHFKKGSEGYVKVAAGEECHHKANSQLVKKATGPLEYSVMLERWDSVTDVYSDGGVVVRCTTETDAYQKPSEGAECTFDVEGTFADGQVYLPPEEKTIFIGEQTCLPALEEALKSVKQGQEATVAVDERYGPEGKAVTLKVKVTNIRSTYSLSWEEKFEGATKRKTLGNEAVKEHSWARALSKYNAALKMIEYTNEEDQDKKDQEQALKLSLHLNCSLVQQKLGDNAECIKQCEKALDIDKANTKALFRQATAHLEIGNLDQAKQGFNKVKEVDPDLKEVDRQLLRLKKKQKLNDKKDKALFAKMMSGVGKGPDPAVSTDPAPPEEAEAEATEEAEAMATEEAEPEASDL